MKIVLPQSLHPVEILDLIRLGQVNDGGYVLPQVCIEQAEVLLSFGLSANWEFEKAFLKAKEGNRVDIYVYDHTVDANYLRKYRIKSLVHFFLSRQKKFWTAFKMAGGYKIFFDGRNARHYVEKVSNKDGPDESSIKTILGRIEKNKKIFLNMDIEGSEYRVMNDLINYADRFVGMGIEFHELDILRRNFWELHEIISKYFAVAHIHVNNVAGLGPDNFPNILEITYINRDLLKQEPRASSKLYPLEGLDMPNSIDREDYLLSFIDSSSGAIN